MLDFGAMDLSSVREIKTKYVKIPWYSNWYKI